MQDIVNPLHIDTYIFLYMYLYEDDSRYTALKTCVVSTEDDFYISVKIKQRKP